MAKTTKSKATRESAGPDLATELLDGVLEEIGDEGGAQLLGSDGLTLKVRGVISTQNAEIDGAIGRGGIPLGRLTIVHGMEASGKTTLGLHIVSEVQKLGGVAVYIDAEYKLDPEYAAKLGVDTKRVIISQPNYLERAFKLIDAIVQKAADIRKRAGRRVPILIVLDSMNALITKHMFEADFESVEIAGPPRVYSAKLPKIMPLVSKEDVALVFISQVRKKIGVMFGDDEDTAGGNAPKFYASLILHVKRLASDREGEVKVGNKVRVEAKKNQIAPPFRRGDAHIRFGKGFDRERALITRGEVLGLVKKSGNTYTYTGAKLGVGIANAVKRLRKDTTVRDTLAAAIRDAEGWGE